MAHLVVLLIWVFGVIGWIMNIVQLAAVSSVTGWAILKGVGIIVGPLGSILGYINLFG